MGKLALRPSQFFIHLILIWSFSFTNWSYIFMLFLDSFLFLVLPNFINFHFQVLWYLVYFLYFILFKFSWSFVWRQSRCWNTNCNLIIFMSSTHRSAVKPTSHNANASSAHTAVGTKVIFNSSSRKHQLQVFFTHTNFKLVFFSFNRWYFEHIQRYYGLFLGKYIKPRKLHSFLVFDIGFENFGQFIEHVII